MTPHPQGEAAPALLPCPLDGGKLYMNEYTNTGKFWAACKCGFRGPRKDSEQEAIKAANRRAPLEGPTGLPPEVEAALQRGIAMQGWSGFDNQDQRDVAALAAYIRSLPPAEGVSEKVRGALEAYLAAGHKEARRAASVLAKEALRLLPEDKRGGEL